MNDSKLAKDLIEAVKRESGTKPYDTTATVLRVQNGIVWVHIDGGAQETPCQMTMNAKEGDVVKVRVSGGQAWLIGNRSAPPTDDKKANEADEKAEAAYIVAGEAQAEAERAHAAADKAQDEAERAREAADTAQDEAERAHTAADTAQGHAEEAKSQAQTATKYANGALDQLSVVQDVVGVLSWASEHGSFTRTQDTTVQDGKVYFTYDSQTGDYTPVVIPQQSALSTYYELTVDEAMQSFIMAHLAVTARGLWVLPNGINTGSVTPAQGETIDDARARLGPNYKTLLASDGMHVYDGAGVEVSVFGENITFNAARPQYIGGEDAFIVFDPTSGEITIGGDVLIDGTKRLSDVLTDLDVSIERTATGADITVNGDTVHLTDGEDAVNVVISSSNGMAFKNDSVDTVLTVTVYYGSDVITNQAGLVSAFGAGSYLQWKAKLYGESTYSTIPASDPRLSDNGFTFTLSPSDVNVQAVFNVEVITPN